MPLLSRPSGMSASASQRRVSLANWKCRVSCSRPMVVVPSSITSKKLVLTWSR
ncbi:hypothetical protein D3C77_693220 [compost metagenome]